MGIEASALNVTGPRPIALLKVGMLGHTPEYRS
jgi:hypothetical protein